MKRNSILLAFAFMATFFAVNAQSPLFYAYGNIQSRTVVSPGIYNITISNFNGGYREYPNSNFDKTEIPASPTDYVVWANCVRLKVLSRVSTSPFVLQVQDVIPSGALDGSDLIGYRIAILQESKIGTYNLGAFASSADGNAGSQAGIAPVDAACIGNYYKAQLQGYLVAQQTAAGDISGTLPTVTVDGIQGNPVLSTAPTTGQVLAWNGTAWAPATGSSGADGNGIYTGSGTIPNSTSATTNLLSYPVSLVTTDAAKAELVDGFPFVGSYATNGTLRAIAGFYDEGGYPNYTIEADGAGYYSRSYFQNNGSGSFVRDQTAGNSSSLALNSTAFSLNAYDDANVGNSQISGSIVSGINMMHQNTNGTATTILNGDHATINAQNPSASQFGKVDLYPGYADLSSNGTTYIGAINTPASVPETTPVLHLEAIGHGKLQITDNTVTKSGLEYAADYAAGYTNRSLVDKQYVDNRDVIPAGSQYEVQMKGATTYSLINEPGFKYQTKRLWVPDTISAYQALIGNTTDPREYTYGPLAPDAVNNVVHKADPLWRSWSCNRYGSFAFGQADAAASPADLRGYSVRLNGSGVPVAKNLNDNNFQLATQVHKGGGTLNNFYAQSQGIKIMDMYTDTIYSTGLVGSGLNFYYNNGVNQNTPTGTIAFRIRKDGHAYVANRLKIGSITSQPQKALDVTGGVRVSDLTTDTPTKLVGADGDNDLGQITLGAGFSITEGTLAYTSQVKMREEVFTAAASQTNFTTTYAAPAPSGTAVPVRVYRNGVRLTYVASGPTITQFTYSSTTITTASNTAGDVIVVEYLQ